MERTLLFGVTIIYYYTPCHSVSFHSINRTKGHDMCIIFINKPQKCVHPFRTNGEHGSTNKDVPNGRPNPKVGGFSRKTVSGKDEENTMRPAELLPYTTHTAHAQAHVASVRSFYSDRKDPFDIGSHV